MMHRNEVDGMELGIEEFVQRLHLNEEERTYFAGGSFVMTPHYRKASNTLSLTLRLAHILPFSLWELFITKLRIHTRSEVILQIICEHTDTDIFSVYEYICHYVSLHPEQKVFAQGMPALEDTFLIYTIEEEAMREEAIQHQGALVDFLRSCGFPFNVHIATTSKDKQNEIPIVHTVVNEASAHDSFSSQTKERPYRRKQKKHKDLDDYTMMQIAHLQEEREKVAIKGKLFEREDKEVRSKKNPDKQYVIRSYWIHDDQDAMIIKQFLNAKQKESSEEFHKGDYVIAYGNVTFDTYLREYVFDPIMMTKTKEEQRNDDAKEKRVELHVHTKLSEMDGVCDIEEFIACADAWGMDAIALTDHMVAQAFPKAQAAVSAINKKRDPSHPFKMIYGVEFNMVDPILRIVRNGDDTLLEKGRYCVFDLETTGLSSRFDHIIEFGAQIMENRECVKSLQMFIQPPVALSAFTTELTGITQEDVQNAPTFAQCADELLEFIGDAILVAHNADFDYNFLNDSLIRIGKKPLHNPVIDTLDLARSLQSDRRGYRLGQIARSYGIRYDEEVAHRADYDAKVLADTFMSMMNDLRHIGTLKDLQDMQDASCFKKVRKKDTIVLAKNAAGLKELFELVTLSHTKYLSYNAKATNNVVAEPRILREEIAKRRLNGNLLIGSACLNGEVFEIAHTRGEEALLEVMRFYDYIEIQPLENYRHLVERDSIGSNERLQEILKAIMHAADRLGKPIVATGDAHYVHPHQKLTRDIYISSQAIGGVRHPLYIYNAEKRRRFQAPDQHFYTTQEMLDAFTWTKRAKELVIENTKRIADQIEVIYPVKSRLYPPDIEGSDRKLREICFQTAHERYGENLPELVEQRLEKELQSIIGHGFYVVYYISHLLVKKSNEDGYLVGSRGSVGSSFVATMSGITEVNPLAPHYVCPKCHYVKFYTDGSVPNGFDLPDIACPNCGEIIRGDGHDIPFETFLGFEGDKVPDIDLNFSGDYQPNAHAYTKEVFGEDHVFRAGTIGTVAEQTAFGYVKGYEEEMNLAGSMRNAQRLYLAKECEGVKRTTGQHPGGIIVVPLDLDVHDFTPVQYPANNPYAEWKTTHFDFHQIHDNVLKFDILGHVDPTAMKLLERLSGIDVTSIPMNDPATMSIFSSVDALNIDTTKNTELTGAAGLPEFGTGFVRGILELTKPTTFDELLKISGLSHGTDVWLGNAKDLIDQGICTLKSVIGCRDDIMVYLLHKGLKPKLAFTIMESVRKGKGLKKEWIPDMKANGVEDWYIESCEKIKYMFPKAHAVAYVMMAIRIAWFKVHHPIYYYSMFFSIRCDAYEIDTMIKGEAAIRARMNEIAMRMDDPILKKEVTKKDKDIYNTLELALEMILRGYRFANIDIMRSDATQFLPDPQDKNVLIPPFTSVDGLGESVAVTVCEARAKGGFLSKQDLQNRTALSATLVKKLESMHVLDGMQDENQMSLFGGLF